MRLKAKEKEQCTGMVNKAIFIFLINPFYMLEMVAVKPQ